MIIVTLKGGLGNQMFQYAAGKAIATRYRVPLLVDTSFLDVNNTNRPGFTARPFRLDVFDMKVEKASPQTVATFITHSLPNRVMRKLGMDKRKVFFENSSPARDQVSHIRPPALLKGYWQSEDYFVDAEAEIRSCFRFRTGPGLLDENLLRLIDQKNSVAIHVRRGDYVTNQSGNAIHASLGIEYYQRAIDFLDQKIEKPFYFFFSDEPAWVKANFTDIPNAHVVETGSEIPDYMDMFYISKCKHSIIANSSFSWWGAWLNHNSQKIVIAPERWFLDESMDETSPVPKKWIRL